MPNLLPDYRFEKFSDITVEFLQLEGIKGLILDIDNTLEPYEHAIPGERVKAWIAELASAGIRCAFVSNNSMERVAEFNASLRLPSFYKAGKPFKKNIIKAMELIGSNKKNTLLLGDQIFTDVWAAKNAGIRSALVPPIKDKRDILTGFKRLLEKPILKKYDEKHKVSDKNEES